ncbi:MAG: trypsin-like peptidase domain-containing protein [Candidatus Krumholzibacteriota bacterium]|nr:trypsin-like peptidase domain-containing protein [Candidatus Krumholzibacteriota bacterium]
MLPSSEERSRAWLPVLTGVLAGLSLAALLLAVFLVTRAPEMMRREAARLVRENPELFAAPAPADSLAPAAAPDIENCRRNAVVRATEKVAPAVVAIVVTQVERYRALPRSISEYFEFFGAPRILEREVPGMGSGVLISPYGRVVTNAHVVDGARRIIVTLSDGRQFPAGVLAVSAKYDIALLQLESLPEGEQVPYAELGDSDELLIGEWVIAIGSPFGFQLNDIRPSVTVGVVSAVNRDIRAEGSALYNDMIQTDAAINPGNSGGPLVNSQGQVVGINTLILSKSGGNLGIGFARPINTLVWVLNEIEQYGKVRDTWAGFTAIDLRPYHIVHYGLKVRQGIIVTRVYNGGPADAAGLEPGDVVEAVDGQALRTVADANMLFFRHEVGDRVPLTVNRDGETHELSLVLEPYRE